MLSQKLLVLCSCLLLTLSAWSQSDTLWSRTYGGESSEQCYAFDMTTDGGCVLAGYTWSFGLTQRQMWLVRTDANGDSLWSRMYGGDEWEECWFVKQVADGGYILVGKTYSYGNGSLDYWLVKADSDGNMEWSQTYGTDATDDLRAAVQTSDGGYAMVGFTYPSGSTDKDFWLVKTNANGDSLWSRTYGGIGADWGMGISQTDDGGLILVGYTDSFSAGDDDIWIIRTDANGDSLWSRTYGGTLDEYGQTVRQASDGGLIIIGGTKSYGAGNWDMWLLKTDANGDTIWTRTFGADSSDAGFAVELTMDGGYIAAGNTRSFGMGLTDAWLIKMDDDGDSLWSMVLGGENYETLYHVCQSNDGSYLLSGHTSSFGQGSNDFWLVKTSPDSITNIDEHLAPFPSSLKLSAYPNPFNSSTTIRFSLPQTGVVKLSLFDITGREIRSLLNEKRPAGDYHLTIDCTDLPSGILFARLNGETQTITQKLMLIK